MPSKKIQKKIKTKIKQKQKQKQTVNVKEKQKQAVNEKQKQGVNVKVYIDQSKKNDANKQSQAPIILSSGGGSSMPYPMPVYMPPQQAPYGLQDIQDLIKSTIQTSIPQYQTVGSEMNDPYGFVSPQDETRSKIVDSLAKPPPLNKVLFATDDTDDQTVMTNDTSLFSPEDASVKYKKPVSMARPPKSNDDIPEIFGIGPESVTNDLLNPLLKDDMIFRQKEPPVRTSQLKTPRPPYDTSNRQSNKDKLIVKLERVLAENGSSENVSNYKSMSNSKINAKIKSEKAKQQSV